MMHYLICIAWSGHSHGLMSKSEARYSMLWWHENWLLITSIFKCSHTWTLPNKVIPMTGLHNKFYFIFSDFLVIFSDFIGFYWIYWRYKQTITKNRPARVPCRCLPCHVTVLSLCYFWPVAFPNGLQAWVPAFANGLQHRLSYPIECRIKAVNSEDVPV